jgi:hypothetical protein
MWIEVIWERRIVTHPMYMEDRSGLYIEKRMEQSWVSLARLTSRQNASEQTKLLSS